MLGVADVLRFEFGDAFDIRFIKLHRHAKGNRSHDGGFVRGINTFNIKSRVSLCITQSLRLFEHVTKGQSFVAHFRQDEIGCAVDDARHPMDSVGTQTFAQSFDDRYATSNSRFKRHHHTFFVRRSKNLCAMYRQQSFVGSHHMLAGSNRFEHQLFGDAITTDEFDHDIYFWIGNHLSRVIHHFHSAAHNRLGTSGVQVSDHRDLYRAASATLDFFLVAFEHFKSATAYGANA